MMRVAVHPCDNGGCGWYRLRWPAQVLAANGYDVVVRAELDAEWERRPGGDRLRRLMVDDDVVVLQRPMGQQIAEAIPMLQRLGHTVVVEVDDDFHSLPVGHGAKRATSVGANPRHNRRWLRIACEQADLVTVTTPALADRYAPHGRVVVLPNLVPEAFLKVPSPRPRRVAPTVGWTGSVVTHVGDLEVMGGVIPGVLEDTGARFVSWGVGLTEEALGVKGRVRPWAELTKGYPWQVADLDVGLVPLADNKFNEAKSWLKGLEYAALGVPFVASPRVEYERLADVLPVVLQAESADGWRLTLGRLLSSPDERAEIADRNREAVSSMTYENHADRWWAAWSMAHDRRKVAA